MKRPIPRILETPGLRVIEVGVTELGCPYLILAADRGRVRQVSVYMRSTQPGEFYYGYTIRDEGSRTEVTYHGPVGDPDFDELGPVEGI